MHEMANVEVTGAARLYRAASGGLMGWASLFGEREICTEASESGSEASPKPRLDSG